MNAGTKKLQQELVLVLDKAGMPKEVVNYVSTTVEKKCRRQKQKTADLQIYHFQIRTDKRTEYLQPY